LLPLIDYGYIMEHGVIKLQGTAAELANDRETGRAYFGTEF
jgi:ABC-type branched-subunit amino acid transport system ATPase component